LCLKKNNVNIFLSESMKIKFVIMCGTARPTLPPLTSRHWLKNICGQMGWCLLCCQTVECWTLFIHWTHSGMNYFLFFDFLSATRWCFLWIQCLIYNKMMIEVKLYIWRKWIPSKKTACTCRREWRPNPAWLQFFWTPDTIIKKKNRRITLNFLIN
jgi:hypothetical protein